MISKAKNFSSPLSILIVLFSFIVSCNSNNYELHSAEKACHIEAEQDLFPSCELYLQKQALDPLVTNPDPVLQNLEDAWLFNCVRYYYQESQCAGRKGIKVIKVRKQ
ncbi:MAG TPA: hypothetical protein DEA96_17735 [Leptospiraceae bacterium]|nr:hypothetical protein [Spirochaetaceae bacterium]HBS06816.1 hypothetical protein [Leptospiraceae bacterium]